MRGATCCSGIGAPETALPDVEWIWCAEIEKFPSAVLARRHPGSKNLGDITAPDFIERALAFGPLDVLVAGTPCQAFSIAGNRGSLNDERGNLTLRFVEIVDAIQPRTVLWENVPGVLSTKDNAFGCFLGALAGSGAALVPNRKQRWTDCGVVDGPKRRVAWRILDAQWFGVAQRRERVFVVASARNENHPAKVLFDSKGLSGNTAPSREAGERTTGTLSARTQGGGGLGTDFEVWGGSYHLSPALTSSGRGVERTGESRGQDCVVPVAYNETGQGFWGEDQVAATVRKGNLQGQDGARESTLTVVELSNGEVSHCLNAGGMGRIDYETETLVTHALTTEGFDASEDGTGRGSPLVPVAIPILEAGARTGKSTDDLRAGSGIGDDGDPMYTLQSGKQHAVICFQERGRTGGRNLEYQENPAYSLNNPGAGGRAQERCIAFSCKDSGADSGSVSPTLRAMEFDGSHANAGGQVAVAFRAAGQDGFVPREVTHPIAESDSGGSGVPSVMTVFLRGREGGATAELGDDVAGSLRAGGGGGDKAHILDHWAVRRLTPVECERLQSFKDGYTDVEYGGKPAADGPRYRALGNSMCVNVVAWIGRRIMENL